MPIPQLSHNVSINFDGCDTMTSQPSPDVVHGTPGQRQDNPMVGSFIDSVGTFLGDDVHEGRPIKVKFIWSHITPASAWWQQELSDDDGVTWELNWVMDFTRAE